MQPGVARAAMLIASPDNPQKPVVNLGSTVWSTIPPAPGQPATVAVKADADIPDLKMHASMTLRKNTDPTLQATHTIDLKFSFADGAPIAGFKDVGAPQMRKLDSTASEALTSVKVKVSDVYFLIALAKGDADTARNLDLMQTRAWFDFPLLLNDNRIAKLVFQKSRRERQCWKEGVRRLGGDTRAGAPLTDSRGPAAIQVRAQDRGCAKRRRRERQVALPHDSLRNDQVAFARNPGAPRRQRQQAGRGRVPRRPGRPSGRPQADQFEWSAEPQLGGNDGDRCGCALSRAPEAADPLPEL